jgi:hypothetical protein
MSVNEGDVVKVMPHSYVYERKIHGSFTNPVWEFTEDFSYTNNYKDNSKNWDISIKAGQKFAAHHSITIDGVLYEILGIGGYKEVLYIAISPTTKKLYPYLLLGSQYKTDTFYKPLDVTLSTDLEAAIKPKSTVTEKHSRGAYVKYLGNNKFLVHDNIFGRARDIITTHGVLPKTLSFNMLHFDVLYNNNDTLVLLRTN